MTDVMIELAELTLTSCPWEVIGYPVPTTCPRDCIDRADEHGRLTECWEAMCAQMERLLDAPPLMARAGRGE